MNLLLEQQLQTFTDEFGAIDHDVYTAAVALWPQAERQMLQALRDEATGWRLLMKACALVTRQRQQAAEKINNLPAYLRCTWHRLMLAELKQEQVHHQIEQAHATEKIDPAWFPAEIENRILLQELIGCMDDWTRLVFQCLLLGFSFEEIGRQLNTSGKYTRNRYYKQLAQLKKRLGSGGE